MKEQINDVVEQTERDNFLIAVFAGYKYPNINNAVWRCSQELHDYH